MYSLRSFVERCDVNRAVPTPVGWTLTVINMPPITVSSPLVFPPHLPTSSPLPPTLAHAAFAHAGHFLHTARGAFPAHHLTLPPRTPPTGRTLKSSASTHHLPRRWDRDDHFYLHHPPPPATLWRFRMTRAYAFTCLRTAAAPHRLPTACLSLSRQL